MLYKLINPSDPYVFEAKDHETAALTVLTLGTMYGAKGEDGEHDVPVTFMIDPEEWFKETFGRPIAVALNEKKQAIADAMLSMTYGNFQDYQVYQNTVKTIEDPAKREQFIKKWADRRSSIISISDRCHRIGEELYKLNGWERRSF